MARKRMLDPEILDSALSKGWKPEDFTVMVAAISTSDDEGRGLISVLKRNITPMISEKKFQKSLRKLDDSIVIYQKIYFFLPKWKNYQSISHPKASKFPEPNYINSIDLTAKSSEKLPITFRKDSDTVKINVKEVSLKEVKIKEENVDNSVNNSLLPNEPPLLFNSSSSFTFYQDCLPFDFQDTDSVRNSITKLVAKFCNGTAPTKSEITRLFNIVTTTKGAKRETCFKITAETLSEFITLSQEKKNFAYICQRIEGKINDAKTKALEQKASQLKDDERLEVENMNGNKIIPELDVISDKFSFK